MQINTSRRTHSIVAVSVHEALPVRHAAYFDGSDGIPLSAAAFDCDQDPMTLHFGVIDNGVCLGVAALTIGADSPRSSLRPAWRLRSMAVLPAHQGTGIGTALLRYAIARVEVGGGGLIWGNIRNGAFAFYERCSFQLHDDVFYIRKGSSLHRYGELWVAASASDTVHP